MKVFSGIAMLFLLTQCSIAEEASSPAKSERKGVVPDYFMLTLNAPGCEPGEQCDDVGPPYAIRKKFEAMTGANLGYFGINWNSTQKEDPGDGEPVFDFSDVKPDPDMLKMKFLIIELGFFGNPWAEKFRFTDIPRYNKCLEIWAEAACRFAREKYGATIFSTGGNERDLVAKDTYQPHYPDWHYYYMDPVKAIHRGMKKAHPDNKLVIGNLCYNDRDHIGALYVAGAKGHFEILAIHAYGPRGAFVDMEQVIESHQEMAYHGDPDIPIILTEGWSCFPLPDSIEHDKTFRGSKRPYTPDEIEHYRQTVLDGWRNLITPRPGFYDPKWVGGASYFVLNDHWGGLYWEERAKAEYDENGKLKGFFLDGYHIGTTDPDWIKPLMRPWGIIDVDGNPKGDIIYNFPPYIPKHSMTATLHEKLETSGYDPRRPEKTCPEVVAGQTYHATVKFQNLEDSPMTNAVFLCGDKAPSDFPAGNIFTSIEGQTRPAVNASKERRIRVKCTSPEPPKTINPGETVTLEYELVFPEELTAPRDNGEKQRFRILADLYYIWEGRPYHTDAWMPRVSVKKS